MAVVGIVGRDDNRRPEYWRSTVTLDVKAMLAGRPELLHDALDRSLAYLGDVADRPVAPARAAVDGLRELDFTLPQAGLAAMDVLRLVDVVGSPATVASNGPRYFGFVIGGTLPVAQAATWLSAAWDQNAALTVMSPVAAQLNSVALRWITELIGLPPGTAGGFVTGATMANTTCLAAARDAVLTRHGWDADRAGPRRRPAGDRRRRGRGAHYGAQGARHHRPRPGPRRRAPG